MRPSVFFSAFEPLHEAPEVCDVCSSDPPVLRYEFNTYGESREAREEKGFCCSRCAMEFLCRLENSESVKWAEEESALKADGFDVADLRQHRLAAFLNNGH
jgi:hypothetical protein